MSIETRHPSTGKGAKLPLDYLKMVEEVFSANFDAGLKALSKFCKNPKLSAYGSIFPTEVILAVSIIEESQLAATTVYGSVDFDPKASSPTIEDLLANCVDAIGSVLASLLDTRSKDKLEKVVSQSLSALGKAPFEWTSVQIDKRTIFVKIDKANPKLDQMADEWLAKHDPEALEKQKEEQAETEKLFITGKKVDPKKEYH